jgi:hypothetical protein
MGVSQLTDTSRVQAPWVCNGHAAELVAKLSWLRLAPHQFVSLCGKGGAASAAAPLGDLLR